jgi:hypothetical protein
MPVTILGDWSHLDDPKTTDDVLDHVDTALAAINAHLPFLPAPFHPELFGHISRHLNAPTRPTSRFMPVVVSAGLGPSSRGPAGLTGGANSAAGYRPVFVCPAERHEARLPVFQQTTKLCISARRQAEGGKSNG